MVFSTPQIISFPYIVTQNAPFSPFSPPFDEGSGEGSFGSELPDSIRYRFVLFRFVSFWYRTVRGVSRFSAIGLPPPSRVHSGASLRSAA